MLGGNHQVGSSRWQESVRERLGLGAAASCVLALTGLFLVAPPDAHAQRVEKGSVKVTPASHSAAAETEVFAAGDPGPGRVPVAEPPPSMASMVEGRPEGWEIYFKAGPIFSLGHGFLEKHVGVGWTAQVGLRQPLYRPDGPWMLFAEFGGGYAANTGRENRPVTTSGIVFFPNDDHIHFANDFYDTQLRELQRGFVQGAVGMFYYPPSWNSPGERLFHVNTRLGVRAGGADAIYFNDVQLGLRTPFDAHAGPNGHGHNPDLVQYFPDAKDPELFLGFFGSVGASVTFYNQRLFGRTFCDITLGADLEFAHEWYGTGAYGHQDHGYGSFTPTFTVSFSF